MMSNNSQNLKNITMKWLNVSTTASRCYEIMLRSSHQTWIKIDVPGVCWVRSRNSSIVAPSFVQLRELEKKNAELISKLFAEQTRYEKKTSDLRVMISELNSSLVKKDSELSSSACCVSLRTLLCMLRLPWDTPYGQLYDYPTSLKKRIGTWIPLS
ncbi:unnamed protein product [Prunus armeniaca]